MLPNIVQYTARFTWVFDVLDILIVAYVIYRVLLLIKGTHAAQMLIGLGIIFILYLVSEKIGLNTIHWVLNNFLGSIVLILIILFQHDIRRALTQVGRNPFFSRKGTLESAQNMEELIKACVSLAGKRVGALIALERAIGLNDFVEIGTTIDSKITKEVLISIFLPTSPIHDGAVILQKGRIVAAGCFLPLTVNPNISKALGTRHRAAIGLTEETDAVVILVSEEDGTISLANEGKITKDLDGGTLRQILQSIFMTKE